MIERTSIKEFRSTGLLMFINMFLHIFGWCIVFDKESDCLYPAKSKFRGFSEKVQTESYVKLTKYLNSVEFDLEELFLEEELQSEEVLK